MFHVEQFQSLICLSDRGFILLYVYIYYNINCWDSMNMFIEMTYCMLNDIT